MTYTDNNGIRAKSKIQSPFWSDPPESAGHADEPKEILADAVSIILGGTSHRYESNPKAKHVLDTVAGWMDEHGWEHPDLYAAPDLPTWNEWRAEQGFSGKQWVQRPDGDEITINKGKDGYGIIAMDHHNDDAYISGGPYRTLAKAKEVAATLMESLRAKRP